MTLIAADDQKEMIKEDLHAAAQDGEDAISANSGTGEYLVSSDSAPYDMRLAFPDLVTEVEGGSAVRRPGQFPDIVGR
jgi:hypothetical protein